MANKRDDFGQDVAEALAKRACFHCSNPDCRAPTVMPSAEDLGKFIYSGIAAHITAAAEGGPRYDATLSSEQRRDITNGIHLCASCSVKIDKNKGLDYPKPLLLEWKEKHEKWIRSLSKASVEGLEAAFQDDFTRRAGHDIVTLVRETRQTIAALARHRHIDMATASVLISRPSATALKTAAETGHIVVVGEPGAGKTAATSEAIDMLLSEGADIIALRAESLSSPSRGMLRSEMNLSLHVDEVLAHWQGDKPGFLIIDGIDGARTHVAAETLRDLIERVVDQVGRWHVIVSVRKFDLRHSPRLQRMFRGEPPAEFCDPEFQSVRHVHIPLLTDEELEQACDQSAELARLIVGASPNLRSLLKVPFNLWLAADLQDDNYFAAGSTPIRTQVGLLERYWQVRIIGEDGNGDGREVLIKRAVEGMLQHGTLSVDRSLVIANDTSASVALQQVLRSHLLVEGKGETARTPDNSVLAFAHHILFDYASARLLLRGLPSSLVMRIVSEPDMVLSIRPSFVLHFQYLWERSATREEFWECALAIASEEDILSVAKLIAPSVAAKLAESADDFEQLVAQADAGNKAAVETLHYVCGAVLSLESHLEGDNATPWCEFIECATRSERLATILGFCPLLMHICDNVARLNANQLAAVGLAARRFLSVAWNQSPPNSWLANQALAAVCRTFGSDTAASEELIRKVIEPSRLAERGYEELPRIAAEIQWLFDYNKLLVADIYRSAYAYKEESTEKTSMGGIVLSLSSTRRQDYDMALYQLAEAYRDFLPRDPDWGSKVIMQAVSDEEERNEEKYGEAPEEQFLVGTVVAGLKDDWGFRGYDPAIVSHLDYSQMLADFCNYLRQIAGDPMLQVERQAILSTLIGSNRTPIVWRCLLEAATALPETYGMELKSLLWAIPILTNPGTSAAARGFLRVMFPLVSPEERQKIEETILAISSSSHAMHQEQALFLRNRLLGDLDQSCIILQQTRDAIGEVSVGRVNSDMMDSSSPSDGSGLLTYPSGPTDPTDRRIVQLSDELQELAQRRIHEMPTPEQIEADISRIREIHSLLNSRPISEGTVRWLDNAWGIVASACGATARLEPKNSQAAELIQEVLLSASTYPVPRADARSENEFARSPSWSWPSARIDAAQGLVTLARRGSDETGEVAEALERLSQDGSASVRYQIAEGIDTLYRSVPGLARRLANDMAQAEMNSAVLTELLGALERISLEEDPWAFGLMETICERVSNDPGAERFHRNIGRIFVRRYLLYDNVRAQSFIEAWIQDLSAYHVECIEVAQFARQFITVGAMPASPAEEAVRQRSIKLLECLASNTDKAIDRILESFKDVPLSNISDEAKSRLRSLSEVNFWIGNELYFASGAFDEKQGARDETQTSLFSMEAKSRFLAEMSPLIEVLAARANARLSYHFLELFEAYADVEPKKIFLLMDRTLTYAQSVGLQYDHMAAEAAVGLVSRFIADYSQILRSDAECRSALLRILNTFVLAGWPAAIRLGYRLGEIYR
jgi:hypothetical protein